MHPFRNLLLVAMGRMSSFEKAPTPKTWESLFYLAKVQSLAGVLYDAAVSLPLGQQPPEEMLADWKELADKISAVYGTHEKHVAELEEILSRMGMRGCVLKGTGLARLYPRPSSRMCGDIDLWVEGRRDKIINAFEEAGYPIYSVVYQECKARVFDDTEVEIHFHASKMYNPFCNARLQRWLSKNAPFADGGTLAYPSACFNAVFCMAHMYRHYLEGGIGMRQMMDYYYVLRQLTPTGRVTAMKAIKQLGMKKFAGAVMTSMWFNFGLEEEYFLCPKDMKLGGRLVNDAFAMGNFGVRDARNYSPEGEKAFARFMRKNRRVFSNIRYYPREVVWSPFSRLSQFVWRKVKRYA